MQESSDKEKARTCCVAGHRDIPADMAGYVERELRREVEAAIADGYLYFLTDFMEGADQIFAQVVADIRKENEAVRLEAVLSYRNRYNKLFDDAKTKPLLLACTEVGFTGEKYVGNSIFVCRRKQLERSSRMIVVFDGRDKGGTVSAIRMAHAQDIHIREIPLGLK